MITVIGAGPAGSYAASLLAKNHDVQVFEEHSSVGLPVQCTGIVTSSLSDLVTLKNDFVLNKITRARIFSPNSSVDLSLKKNLVIDRTSFDRYLVGKAIDNGAILHLNHKFRSLAFKNNRISLFFDGRFRQLTTDILVGADGPLSQVAKSSGLFHNKKLVVGLQARVSMGLDSDLVEFYLNRDYFGWVVPESSTVARIGIISYNQQNLHFKKFLKKMAPSSKVREYQSGIIPLYNPKPRRSHNNVFLVGDAASQVKATTFGGIIQGLIAARELSAAINNNKDYERLWRRKLAKDLWISLMIRKKLDKFSNKHYDDLISMFQKKNVKSVIERFDRDFPSMFVFDLLLRQPRLLKFLF